jgi:choline kinase
MKAVILAAGRGSRLKKLTESKPKCLTELAGKPLLFWQLEALFAAGIEDIAVVRGYLGETIAALADSAPARFFPLENPRWESTNMLSTLLCAADWVQGDECVISYSDIAYPARHVQALLACAAPVAITYDRDWQALWSLRQSGNPLEDAETFREENGLLQEIGARPDSLDQVRGQYMGLLKLSSEGWNIWLQECRELGSAVDKCDMTGFLRRLLDKRIPIGAVPVDGAWCEVDSERDLELYHAALEAGTFSHDWRK